MKDRNVAIVSCCQILQPYDQDKSLPCLSAAKVVVVRVTGRQLSVLNRLCVGGWILEETGENSAVCAAAATTVVDLLESKVERRLEGTDSVN